MKMTRGFAIVALLALAFVSGCASQALEKDRGTSVSNMITGQTYNPEAAASPPLQPVSGMDGVKALSDLNRMTRNAEATRLSREIIKLRRLTKDVKD